MSIITDLFSRAREQRQREVGDAEAGTLWTTPWRMRDEEGTYFGHSGQVWLYRSFPLSPLEWEDPGTRVMHGDQLASLLATLGSTSRVPIGALRSLSKNREIHLVSVTWEAPAEVPEGTPPRLRDYLDDCLGFLVPHRALLIGVRLWPSSAPTSPSTSGVMDQMKTLATKALAEDVPDRAAYEDDRKVVGDILSRFGCKKLTRVQDDQLESWYNMGRGPDVAIIEKTTSLDVASIDTLEMSAVMRFTDRVMSAPDAQWILDAAAHADAPKLISVRAELEPAAVTRSRARTSQRRLKALAEEEAQTGDLGRVEVSDTFQQAQEFETFLVSTNEPILTNCSILMARSVADVDETYMDFLNQRYGIQMKPLEHRQLVALDETLPCSNKRVNPFLQDVSISMLAFAGMHGFANLGDAQGIHVGLADPDLTNVWLDPAGAPKKNLPATMLVAGDSGGGKAQPLDAKILTPTGWTTMGELSVGDQVIGRSGRPTTVVGVYPQGVKDIYRVTLSDGSSTETCAEHLWSVRRSNYAARGRANRILQTSDLLAERTAAGTGTPARWFIPVVDPVEFPEADLPLDPYVVGVLLGDGGVTTRVSLSSDDDEILAEVRSKLPAGCTLRYRSGYDWAITKETGRDHPLRRLLRENGIDGTDLKHRRLPETARSWSASRQRAFLFGAASVSNTDGDVLVLPLASHELAQELQALILAVGGNAEVVAEPRTQQNRAAWVTGRDHAIVLRWKADLTDVPVGTDALLGALTVRGRLTHFPHFGRLSAESVATLRSVTPTSYRFVDRGNHIDVTAAHNEVLDIVRDLGLAGHKSETKFVPATYLFGSVRQRVELLQGLMDTDGTVQRGSNSAKLTTTSPQLADDVEHLARSLGGTTRRTTKQPYFRGPDGERRKGLLAYTITMHLPSGIPPFRLARKADLYRDRDRQPARGVVAVEFVRSAEAQCIAVADDEHLYVTDDFVVTHNTFLAQSLATQSVLAGYTTIMINPKGFSSLSPFAELVDGTVIKMSALEKTPGAFDPFRYAPPEVAAEIATQHILDVLEKGFTQAQRLELGSSLKRGAIAGARCVGQAMAYVRDDEVKTQVWQLMQASSLFALGIALEPRDMFDAEGGLTLIEFDRKLDLPEASTRVNEYSESNRLALAAIRLVIRASGEILANAGGGVLIADEAWTFLQNTTGLAALQQMSREGRSQNILPILLTQRVADVVTHDLEGYLSRVFCMKMTDPRDAEAALRLCGLEPTQGRIQWLANCGPRAAEGDMPARWAMGLHRDLDGRHSAVLIGPVPEAARIAFTTNPEEMRARDAARAEAEAARAAEVAAAEAPQAPDAGLDDLFG